jgi:methionine sulfoxide reductase catalytic subunit
MNSSMLIKKPADIASSEITPKNVYLNRRNLLVGAALAGAAAAAGVVLNERRSPPVIVQANAKIDGIQKSKFSTSEAVTPYKDVTNQLQQLL